MFYIGTNNSLYHNDQTSPNGTWGGEVVFSGDSAKDLTVGQNSDGTLEIFYAGTNNSLYHNWQTTPNGPWAGETVFSEDSALQVTVAKNQDGRLELFYVGTNSDVYHNWQRLVSSQLGSNNNYIFSDNCTALKDVSVTIQISEDLVPARSSSGSISGLSFQLNGYSPTKEKVAWQQYCINLFGNKLGAFIDNWPESGDNLINFPADLVTLPSAMIPAGYQLKISLQNDSNGIITGATYTVTDDKGKTIGNTTLVIEKLLAAEGQVTQAVLLQSPIIGFEVNLVGPANGEGVILSSGAGTITYQASTPMMPSTSRPTCAESSYVTAETSNSLYDSLPASMNTSFTQTFYHSVTERVMIRKEGTPRPSSPRPMR